MSSFSSHTDSAISLRTASQFPFCSGTTPLQRIMQHKIALNSYSVPNSLSLLRLHAIRVVYNTLTRGMQCDGSPVLRVLVRIVSSPWLAVCADGI